MARVLLVVITVAITIYAVADIARTPNDEMPARVPKALWLLLAILLTPLGGLAWIIVSRVTQAEARGGQVNRGMWYSDNSALNTRFGRFQQPPRRESKAPDDDPEFLWTLEKQVRRHQQELEKELFNDELLDEYEAQLRNLQEDAAGDPDSPDSTADPSEPREGEEHPRSADEPGEADDSGNADNAGDTDTDSGEDDERKDPPASPLA